MAPSIGRVKPVLVFAVGNPSRGDDALGPRLIEWIEQDFELRDVELLTDFQLQIEHALDLQERCLVLFIDAAESLSQAFEFRELTPLREFACTSHALRPEAVLAVYQSINRRPPPPCFLLAVHGHSFELGDRLSSEAENHLQQVAGFVGHLLAQPKVDHWRHLANSKAEPCLV